LVRYRSAESTIPDALSRLNENRFAFVLIDTDEQAGVAQAAVKAIRASASAKSTPIVICGPARPNVEFLEAIFSAGAVDYIEKPIALAALSAKVRGLVEMCRIAERAEREAEQFRMTVQGTKDYAIFMLDPQGRVSSWNAGAELLKGYSSEEIIGQHLSRFYPTEVVESGWVDHELRMAAAAGRFEDEGWRLRKDGSRANSLKRPPGN
jgi:PAS domain S-box-containing protein